MKRTFSWIAIMLAGIMLLITSCTNSSQIKIDYKNNAANEVDDDGLSDFAVKFEGDLGRAAILPDDWTEENKQTLLFQLTGTAPSATVSLTKADAPKNVFTWDEIKHNKAIVKLDPKEWGLVLTAYKVDSLVDKSASKLTVPVLKSPEVKVNLAGGDNSKEFPLSTAGITTDAEGDVDVQVKFYNDTEIVNATFKLMNGAEDVSDSAGANLKGKSTAADGFAKIGDDGFASVHLTGKAKAGDYQLELVFTNTKNQEIGSFEAPIKIDGGNRSSAVIELEKGIFARIPETPSDLKAVVSFAPENAVAMDLGAGHKLTGVEVAANIDDPKLAPTIPDSYNAKFTWIDESYNEKEFELVLTLNSGTSDETVTVTKTADSTKNASGCITSTSENVKWVAGSLHAGSESLTLSIPMGTKIVGAKLTAKNNIESAGTLPCAEFTPANDLGMFTVTYGLTTYSIKPAGDLAKVYYTLDSSKNETPKETTQPYFVVAYNFGTTKDKLIKGNGKYPFIKLEVGADLGSKTKLEFGEWKQKDADSPYNAPKTEEITMDKNIVVYPTFVAPFQIKVNFPEYGANKEVEVIDPTKTLVSKIGVDDLVITPLKTNAAVSGSSFTGWKYKITELGAEGGTNKVIHNDFGETPVEPAVIGLSIASDTGILTWKTTDPSYESKTGGNYSIYVGATYKASGDAVGIPVGTNIYVELKK